MKKPKKSQKSLAALQVWSRERHHMRIFNTKSCEGRADLQVLKLRK